ncbi:protein STRUBBELIG-RECEPTOR FAMILY 6-like [Asparagus officinalis]|nr:protein STRUBBELIG-RECEPTOR FAMILY 6-like [Asparagus officinalis]
MLPSMTSLIELDLSNNNLGGGSEMPYNLPPNLQSLNLAGNAFGQGIPYSISLMVSLKYLNLNHNQLQGDLNDIFAKLTNLSTLDLSFNSLTGDLPESFGNLSSLTKLYLQNNQFTGTINCLANLPLEDLNVANNHFSGWIPDQLKGIHNLQTDGNSWSSGPSPPPPPGAPPSNRRTSPGHRSGGISKRPANDDSNEKKTSGIGAGGIAGIIISILFVGAIIAFLLVRKKHLRTPANGKKLEHSDSATNPASNIFKEMKPIQFSPANNLGTFQSSAPTTLKPPPADQQKSIDYNEHKPAVKKPNAPVIKATFYSVADLQMATDSFSIDSYVGEGSIGRVYRANFNDGKVLAVKKINLFGMPNQSTENFIEVVSNISHLHHPNISELVGYCSEHGQHLLAYEFHKNGSLHDLLHLMDEYSKPLVWNARVKIALGSARALEYLHEVCSPSIVHKNFKSSNILLDVEFNPHLSECGLASFVPDLDYQALDNNMGSGYTAPEVAMSGQYTLKSDVYSFGVVMLELLTGRKPFDSSRPRSEQSLVRWAFPQLHDIDALDKMVDPALEGLYPAKALSRFADVIALCVQVEPEFRPPMSEVVQALVRLLQRAHMSKRTRSIDKLEAARRTDDSDSQDFVP